MPAEPTPSGATPSGATPSGATASGAGAPDSSPHGYHPDEPGAFHSGDAPRRLAQTALRDIPWEIGVAKPDPVVVVDGITRTFGGLTAVSVDHLEVQRGGITGLIGPNGAGKTTLFNLLTGFDQPDTGSWTYDGRDMSRTASHQVARLGVVRTFQLTKALSRLTVLENMLLGAHGQRGESFLRALIPGPWKGQEKANTEKATTCSPGSSWTPRRTTSPAALRRSAQAARDGAGADERPPGRHARRADGRREPGADPEPARARQGSAREGMTVIFVEHDMDVVRDISDWVVVMAAGRVIAEGPPESISQNQAVVDAYLGAHHDAPLTVEEEDQVLAEADGRSPREENSRGRVPQFGRQAGRDRTMSRAPVRGRRDGRGPHPRAEAGGLGQLSPAEKAATREEHERLAEGALMRADDLVAGYMPGSTSCAAATST